MLSGVIPATFTRPEATAYTPNSSRRRSTCSFVQATEGEHAVLFDDKAEVAICAFSCKRIDEQLTHTLNTLAHISQFLFPKSRNASLLGMVATTEAPCAGGLSS